MTATSHDLTGRLRSGDDDVFGELFTRLRTRLHRSLATRMPPKLAGRVDPDDIVQETFMVASRRLDSFRATDVSAFVWLRTLGMQVLVDLTRHHLGAQKRDVDAEVSLHTRAGDGSAVFASRIAGALTSPTRAAVRAELIAQLEDALEGLSDLDREILTLRHFEQMSNNEAAEVLGIDKSTSTKRYLRALRRFKDAIDQFPELAEQFDR